MRKPLLLAAFFASLPALAEDPPAPAPAAPAPAAPVAKPAAAPVAKAAPAKPEKQTHDQAAEMKTPPGLAPALEAPYFTGLAFVQFVIDRDLEGIVANLRPPFYFDGKIVTAPDDVKKHWADVMNAYGRTTLTLYSLDAYTVDEMTKKYGRIPPRLAGMPMNDTVVLVANINGRASIVSVHKERDGWKVNGFSD